MQLPRELGELKWAGQPLTPGQYRVLRLIAEGYSYAETAEQLGVSFETVKRQLTIVRRKLKARNTCHAVALAVSWDLI